MGVKISELQELTEIDNTDVLPIVDMENDSTKKITFETLKKKILEINFPIGSTYVTQTDVNPATIMGFGTWERLKGRIAIGLDEEDTLFNSIGKTGGETKHTMKTSELVNHTHKPSNGFSFFTGSGASRNAISSGSGLRTFAVEDGDTNNLSAQSNTGNPTTSGGQPFNVMNPYQVVGYMWIRTA